MEFKRPVLGTGLVFLLAMFVMASVTRADLALPPTIVNVEYNGVAVSGPLYAAALFCSSNTSSNSQGVITPPQLNVTSFDSLNKCYWTYDYSIGEATCSASSCRFDFLRSTDFRLVFYLQDVNKTFVTTEIINGSTFNYTAQLYSGGYAKLIAGPFVHPPVNPTFSDLVFVGTATIITVIIEVIMAFLYLGAMKIKDKNRVLLFVAIANVISVPVVWFVFVLLLQGWGFVLGELFAIAFDGYFVLYFNKKKINLPRSMLMSVIMNITSLVVGAIILFFWLGYI